MNRFTFSACLILFVGAVVADDPTVSLPGVEDLTPATFDRFVDGKKHALVEFYAPWCGHCKRLTPEFKKLGDKITSDNSLKNRVVIAKVDADEHKELGQRFGVRGFPTLKWFPRGVSTDEPEDYTGGRTMDAFLEFITEKLEADKGFARVESLDELAKSFVSADNKDAVLKEMKEKVEGLSGDEQENGNLYITVMEKALAKGVEYFSKELARVNRMLDSGNVNQAKVQDMTRKVSVLSAFIVEE